MNSTFLKDYLSSSLWEKKYEEEIKEAKKMSKEEKFDMIIELNLMGLSLIEANDKEKKLKLYQTKSKIDRERLMNFIVNQLEK